MKIKLSSEKIKEILEIESPEFPKYTTQLINLANQNSQGTRPKVVGQLSELIEQFRGHELEEWESWYLKQHPEAIKNATERIVEMMQNLKEAMTRIDKELIEQWVKDLVIVKTFIGPRFQKSILKAVATELGKPFRLSSPEDESKGIDGYIGNDPVSIKPITYQSKQALQESIKVTMIFYQKEKNGISIEF